METHRQGTTLFDAILALIGIGVLLQLWLVSAALDALRSDRFEVLSPAALSSFIVLLINAGLLGYVIGFDRRLRRDERERRSDFSTNG